jgi:hypothetical protein
VCEQSAQADTPAEPESEVQEWRGYHRIEEALGTELTVNGFRYVTGSRRIALNYQMRVVKGLHVFECGKEDVCALA